MPVVVVDDDCEPPNPAMCRVRRNGTTDSRAFVAACEAFAAERHPLARPSIRVQHPPGGVSTVDLGHYDIAQETEDLLKSCPGAATRKSEAYRSTSNKMGSGNGESNGAHGIGMRKHQTADRLSHRSFGDEECALLDRPGTPPVATKLKDLSRSRKE